VFWIGLHSTPSAVQVLKKGERIYVKNGYTKPAKLLLASARPDLCYLYDMRTKHLVSALAILAVTACGDSNDGIDVTTFKAPDSLGRALLVAIKAEEPLGSVSFISFGDQAAENIRLVNYFSDGTVLAERLKYNSVGELQAEDGAPRFVVTGNSVVRLCDYTNVVSCLGTNVTRQGGD
jgi:hypothetical protein